MVVNAHGFNISTKLFLQTKYMIIYAFIVCINVFFKYPIHGHSSFKPVFRAVCLDTGQMFNGLYLFIFMLVS